MKIGTHTTMESKPHSLPDVIKQRICYLHYKNSVSTGIVIDQQYILTVRHLFQPPTEQDPGPVDVQIGAWREEAALVKCASGSFDIALLRFRAAPPFLSCDLQLAAGRASCISVGDEVICCGYHQNSLSVTKGLISKTVSETEEREPLLIVVNGIMHNGYSGGGVFDKEGHLVGFIVYQLILSQLGKLKDLNFCYNATLFGDLIKDIQSHDETRIM